MRKILIVASVILTLCACSKISLTPEGRAKNLIKEHLKEHLGNPKSYDPIGFSELLVYPDDDWACMIHYFRAENGYGGIVKYAYYYTFDSNAQQLDNSIEITEEWIEYATLFGGTIYNWALNELSEQGFL